MLNQPQQSRKHSSCFLALEACLGVHAIGARIIIKRIADAGDRSGFPSKHIQGLLPHNGLGEIVPLPMSWGLALFCAEEIDTKI